MAYVTWFYTLVETGEKTLWTDWPNAFLNDIPPRRTKDQYRLLLFNTYNFYVGKILSWV